MKSRRQIRQLLHLLIAALVLIPSISSYADTTRYTYDEANKKVRVEAGGGTAVITATSTAGGSISPAGAIGVRYTDSQRFDIFPDPHYHIVDVKVDNVSQGVITTYTFSNLGGNHTIHAIFAMDTYTLNVSRNNAAGGTVTSSPAGINCGSDCSEIYNYNTTVTLTATPATGYDFLGWTGACGGTGTCVVTMDAAKDATANFVTRTYTIVSTVDDDSKGIILAFGNVVVDHGSTPTFLVIPKSGYNILNVKVDNISLGVRTFVTFNPVTADHTIWAGFYCSNLPVRIARATPVYFSTLQTAYDAAANGEVIQSRGIGLTGDLIAGGTKSVTVEGGYYCDYATRSGDTIVKGKVQTMPGSGTLTLKNLIIGEPLITPASTVAMPPGGAYNTAQSVTLVCSGTCDNTYYTTDGSTPTQQSAVYAGPIEVTANTILKFFSTDTSGRRESLKTEFYVIDSTASTGLIKINNDAIAVNTTNATLSLTCNDGPVCSQMQFSNDNSIWSTPEAFASTKGWTLAAGSDGIRTVYAKFKDSAENWSTAFSDTVVLDTIIPATTPSLPEGTYHTSLDIALKCSDYAGAGCDKVYYTTDGSTPTTGSAQYTGPIALAATTTLKYFAVDRAGNQEAVQSKVYTIDTTVPVGTITINSGAAATNAREVTLTLTCSDGVSCQQMRFSNDNAVWSTPEAFSTTKAWTLSAGDETKTVYVRFKNTAGNWTPQLPAIKDTILLETGAPTTTADPVGGIFTAPVSVTLTCADGSSGAGCDRIFYTTDGSTPTTASAVYTGPIYITDTTTVKFFAIDFASNQEAVKSQSYAFSPVRILNTGQRYATLQAAYNDALEGYTIQAQGAILIENVNINRAISVTLDGGYNNDFTARTGMTTLKGQLQTSPGGGTLTLKNFIVTQ